MRCRRFEIYIKKINEIGGNEALLEKGERLKERIKRFGFALASSLFAVGIK